MNYIEAIRQAFDKGNIIISKHGISVFYNLKNRCISQSVFGNDYTVFCKLVGISDSLSFERIKGRFVKINFRFEIDNQETVFYNPVNEEVSIEELNDILSSSVEPDDDGFLGFFFGVDLDDDNAVIQRFREYLDSKKTTDTIVDFLKYSKWSDFYKRASTVFNSLSLEYEVLEPDTDFDGCVIFELPQNLSMSKNCLGILASLLSVSDGIDIETDINEGFLNISFYPNTSSVDI